MRRSTSHVSVPSTPEPHGGFHRLRPPSGALIRITPSLLLAEAGELTWHPSAALVHAVTRCLALTGTSPRLALVHHAMPTFRAAGLAESEAVEWTRRLRRELCDQAFERLCERYPDELNPSGLPLEPIEFDLDGYGINVNFMGDGIDFRANQQAHFDIVEPLGSNLYGPNVNIRGGWPVFCDGRAYCRDRGLDIREILDKVPASRNLTFRLPHYRALLEDYSVAYQVDMTDDTPFTVFVNRVEEAGLLHGATEVAKADPGTDAQRPIRHYAWDNVSPAAADRWYAELGQENRRTPGEPHRLKPLIPESVRTARTPLLIPVPGDPTGLPERH